MLIPWSVTKETSWSILSPLSSTSQLIISTSSFLHHLQLLQLNSIAATTNVIAIDHGFQQFNVWV
jgi:hypothetical protein